MARARNIKPGFFKNELLVEHAAFVRLLFVGLWTLADREGRLEDRPKRIKLELFPYDSEDVDASLSLLACSGFIQRYTAKEVAVIQIVNFLKHQTPHGTEKDSLLPDSDGEMTTHERDSRGYANGIKRAFNVNLQGNNVSAQEGNVSAEVLNSATPVRHQGNNALNPESRILNPDSLNPDLLNLGKSAVSEAKTKGARGSRLPQDFEPDFQFASDNGVRDTSAEFAKFSDYWISQPGQKGVKTDWQATWRNWCRNSNQGAPRSSQQNKHAGAAAVLYGNLDFQGETFDV